MKLPRPLRRLLSAFEVCLAVLDLAGLLLLVAALPACSLLHPHQDEAISISTPLEMDPGLAGSKATPKGLSVELKAAPDPLKLGEVRQIDVTLALRNTSKLPLTLKFANSQTIEIVLRDQASGKIVSQWSTDQTFQPPSRNVVINPHERIEYNQPITTRDLHAGTAYTLEAYFVGYDHDLRATKTIIPQP
jgi:hypothetical protein